MGITNVTQSKSFSLNKQDIILWGKNAAIFLIPTLVVFLGSVIQVVPNDWKYATITLYILNRLVALLKLYIQGN